MAFPARADRFFLGGHLCKIKEEDLTLHIIVDGFDTVWGERIRQVRTVVFSLEQKIDPALDLDGQDPFSLHVLAEMSGQFVGTGRMLPDGHIGRLAVLNSVREKGIGEKLVAKLFGIAKQKGMSRVFLGAQEHAVGFYEKLGFQKYGFPYEEAGIQHIHMEKMIPLS